MRRVIISVLAIMFIATASHSLIYGAELAELVNHTTVSDHIMEIEISTTFDYELPSEPLHYEFNAWIDVDDTVVSGNLQVPDGNEYELGFDNEDPCDPWLGFEASGPDISVLDDFGVGTYTFTVNYSGGGSDSTSIDYALPNGDPIPYVTQEPYFIYPLHNAVDVPLNVTFSFAPATDPNLTIGIYVVPRNSSLDVLTYEAEGLPYDTNSHGPVRHSPDTFYDIEYTFDNVVRTVNADGIPAVLDTDAECDIRYTTASLSRPRPPRNVDATDGVFPDKVVVRWTRVPGAKRYRLFRSDTLHSPKIPLGRWRTRPAFADRQVSPGVTYYYWVKSRNLAGVSRFSRYDEGFSDSE